LKLSEISYTLPVWCTRVHADKKWYTHVVSDVKGFFDQWVTADSGKNASLPAPQTSTYTAQNGMFIPVDRSRHLAVKSCEMFPT
jgi:hypothetical protein